MDEPNRDASTFATVLMVSGAFLLAVLAGWTSGFYGPGLPQITVPLPFPWLLLGPVSPAGAAIGFWLWGSPLLYRKPTGRRRTRIGALVIGLLSLWWIYVGWDYGLKYQNFRYTLAAAIGSLVFAVAIAAILASSKRTDSFGWSFAANLLLFAWLVTYAFPYFGVLP